MEDAQQRMVQRLSMLIAAGYGIIGGESDDGNVEPSVQGMYVEWRLGSQSFLSTVFSPDNVYVEAFGQIPAECPNGYHLTREVHKGLGILRAAQTELGFGALPGIETLFSAEIFADFLAMAEHLLDQKYFAVVPSLVGAVLEDGLRKIAKRKGLTVKVDDSIAGLNGRLFDVKTYSPLVRRKIEVWNSIRNNADHGKFEENPEQDVGQMLDGVRGFLAEYLK